MDLEYDKKIRSGELIACSRCCEDNVTKQVGQECNTKLCGIRPSGTVNVLKF